jgi:CBS domain-containing protein
MVPLVSFARLYALRHGAHASSTLERLGLLKERGLLTPTTHNELCDAFSCLLGLRLRHQAARAAEGHSPDNLVNPKSLSRLELARLREALGQIQLMQERVKLEWGRKE